MHTHIQLTDLCCAENTVKPTSSIQSWLYSATSISDDFPIRESSCSTRVLCACMCSAWRLASLANPHLCKVHAAKPTVLPSFVCLKARQNIHHAQQQDTCHMQHGSMANRPHTCGHHMYPTSTGRLDGWWCVTNPCLHCRVASSGAQCEKDFSAHFLGRGEVPSHPRSIGCLPKTGMKMYLLDLLPATP